MCQISLVVKYIISTHFTVGLVGLTVVKYHMRVICTATIYKTQRS